MNMLYRLAAGIDTGKLPKAPADSASIGKVLQIVFMLFGAVALLIITLAGLKYVLSQGDPQAVAKAKDTILYAIIGLVIAILAVAIVSFVFKNL
jgi:hypothetical protein